MKYNLNIISFFLAILVVPVHYSFSQDNYWQQNVDNKIHVKLIPEQKKITGRQVITYSNNSPDSLAEIYFHLYPNAYTDTSIMSQEIDKSFLFRDKSEETKGWIRVDSLRMEMSGQSINIDSLKLVYDGTIMKVCFSPAIYQGNQAKIFLNFESKIRKYSGNKGKGGYSGNQFEFCHWYPKVCVYDQNGWNAIPCHWLGEFYGEFGAFDVTINVPDSYMVAATGELVNEESKIEIAADDSYPNLQYASNKTSPNFSDIFSADHVRKLELTYHAENVHNFAWVCNPDLVHESDVWQGIKIDVYYKKKSRSSWENKVMADAKLALSWLTKAFGDYPYPKITLCEQIDHGGMEYPMIVLINAPRTDLIFHEIAHQYFYGAVGNNELTDAWLDEGLVTYQTLKFVEYKKISSRTIQTKKPAYRFLRKQFERYNIPNNTYLNSLYNYFYSGFEKPLSYPCYKLKNIYLYTYHVYTKPTKFFEMLEYTVGREVFDKMIKEYYREWKFKHVNAWSLQSVCERVSGMNLDWLFNQWLYTTDHVDYACNDVTSKKNEHGMWETNITVNRLLPGISPVEAEITTETGEKHRKKWLGKEKSKTITFLTPSKVKQVQLDPDDRILDKNRMNNSSIKIKPFLYHNFYSMYHLPRNAYSLFLWPRIWYNDLDGAKIGLKAYGSYLNRYYVTRNQFWYNLKSRKLDFDIGYSMPWESIHNNLWRHIYIKNIEGRREININLNYNFIRLFNSTPEQIYRFGFSHLKATDTRYTLRTYQIKNQDVKIQTWDTGRINQLYFNFLKSRIRQPSISNDFSIEFSHKNLGSDYNFVRLFHENKYTSRRYKQTWQLRIRNYIGLNFGDKNNIPIQRQYWIGEGNPVKRFKYYYLRSPGSFPAWINYYFPGDGSLKGYANKLIKGKYPITSNRLVSTNLELLYHKSGSLLPKKLRKHLGTFQLLLFFDAAYAQITHLDTKLLMDAGIRLQIHKQFLDRTRIIRFDFPLWLSHPVLDEFALSEPHWKFRWCVSFQ